MANINIIQLVKISVILARGWMFKFLENIYINFILIKNIKNKEILLNAWMIERNIRIKNMMEFLFGVLLLGRPSWIIGVSYLPCLSLEMDIPHPQKKIVYWFLKRKEKKRKKSINTCN